MRYRRFGKTELQIPVLSCGGMRYQHKWSDATWDEIPKEGQDNLEATIRRAVELGIHHIETARGYGSSELQLGRILPEFPRENLIVQTKVGPTEKPDDFLKNFEKSLSLLRLDYVDLLSLHGINDEQTLEWGIRQGGCLEAARRLQDEGLVRHIGFSTHGSCDLITQAIETGEFSYVNLHWYFVNDFNRAAVEAAARQDMGVFIISPSDKGGMLYKPTKVLLDLCRPLTPMMFNDLYCLRRPDVHTLSIGAARPGDFDEHIAALEFYDRITEVVNPIEVRLRQHMSEKLGEDWCAGWWQGIPEFQAVPGEVNLLEILRLWGLAKAFDMRDFGRMRYNLLGNAGHWFPGQKFDPAKADSIGLLLKEHPFGDRIPAILAEAHEWLEGEEKKRLSES